MVGVPSHVVQLNIKVCHKNRFIVSESFAEMADAANVFFKEVHPIDPEYMFEILKVMKKNAWTKEKLIQAHEQSPNKSIWRIVSRTCKI